MNKQSKISLTIFRAGVFFMLVVILLVILIKYIHREKDSEILKSEPLTSAETIVGSTTKDSLLLVAVDSGSLQKPAQPPARESLPIDLLPENVLAKVNNETITLKQFDSIFNTLPTSTRDYYKDDKPGFLEEIITRKLLLQESRRQKIQDTPEFASAWQRNPDRRDDIMITILLQGMINKVTLSEDELKSFFEKNKDQLPDQNYESAKEQIRPMALEEKQQQLLDNFIKELKAKTPIVRNQKWLSNQQAQTADNPLSRALKSGKPTVADFGRGTCVPCKMMQPILEKLQQEYNGRATILILDVGEYASLARRYGIRLIPTQLFFDASGREVHRHQGFMPEADIVAQLKKLGVE